MNIKSILAMLAVVGFFAVLIALFLVPIPQANGQMINTVVVALISIVSAVVGYYFGSSEGSTKKNEILDRVANPPLLAGSTLVTGQLKTTGSEAGFIRLPVLIAMLLISLLCISGCATTSPSTPAQSDSPQVLAGKSLLAVKSTIVVAATTADRLCSTGTMATDKCAMARTAYDQSRLAYDAAVDSYLLMVMGSGDPAAFTTALQRVQNIATNMLQLTGGAK